ncbi:hypothetical protein VCRA2122O12_40147 [Vibrio crassostreae]|nr:hypothetical protein VCRA2110O4_40145 [Vibrio crassostreae]CAK2085091.1 hypothetical protein VCRA2110O1_40148 [Vibrio crassostreae]CAK3008889.1 hypothetical protein VCRA2122O10_60167 [Vibrio crassostreae]CAK3519896.1 hypothetical protein VCRA2122O12_40147 [Vibrio crassostreae]CAK3577163.1 hypothetical protein VCRA2120O9_60146 [Vibrio crassostreae]
MIVVIQISKLTIKVAIDFLIIVVLEIISNKTMVLRNYGNRPYRSKHSGRASKE